MDLEEWELLPMNNNNNNNHGLNSTVNLEDDDDDDDGMIRKIIFPTKRNLDPSNPRDVLDMDYFICRSQDQTETELPNQRSTVVPTTHLLQVPKSWEPIINTDDTDNDHGGKIIKNPDPDPDHDPGNPDLVPSPRVSFKKMKENEFVDMKIDPVLMRTTTNSSPLPQIENKKHFESDSDGGFGERSNKIESEGEKLSIWKLGLTGIGAICSFGVAAATATFCIIFMGSNNHRKGFTNKNQMLQFQIYTDDKRMKEVVNHATKLNEAISVMQGVPMARAQISFGGYYDGL